MKKIGIGFIVAAVFIAFLIWGLLVPYARSLVPPSEWANLIKLGITIVIGYGGGIGLPLGLFLYGLFFCKNW